MESHKGNARSQNPSFAYLGLIILLTIVGTYLRFRSLGDASLRMDEMDRLSWVKQSTWWGSMAKEGANFGVFGLTFRQFVHISGISSEFEIRLVSALAGSLLVPICGEIGRRCHSEHVGVISATLIAISIRAIRQSQEFAQYSLGTTVLWFSFLLLLHPKTRSSILPVVLLGWVYLIHNVASITVILLVFSVFSLEFFGYLNSRRESGVESSDLLKGWFAGESHAPINRLAFAHLGLLVFTIPIMTSTSSDYTFGGYISPTPDDPLFQLMIGLFGVGRSFAVILASLVALSMFNTLHSLWEGPRLPISSVDSGGSAVGFRITLITVAFGTLFVVLLYSEIVRPLFVPRFFLFSIPAWALLIGLGISDLVGWLSSQVDNDLDSGQWSVFGAISLYLMAYSVEWIVNDHEYYEYQWTQNSDFRSVALEVDSYDLNEDVMLVSSPGARNYDTYFEWFESDLRVGFAAHDFVPDRAYLEVENGRPSQIVYMVGQNPERMYDKGWTDYLLESDYRLEWSSEYYRSFVYVFYLEGDMIS